MAGLEAFQLATAAAQRLEFSGISESVTLSKCHSLHACHKETFANSILKQIRETSQVEINFLVPESYKKVTEGP